MREQIAKGLLDIGAVKLNVNDPFVWASGIKSPVFSDNRLTLTAPSLQKSWRKSLQNASKSIIHRQKS